MEQFKRIIEDSRNKKKQLLDNALEGVDLSTEDQAYITYLVNRCDLYELQRLCNLFIKVWLQGQKQ